MARKCIHFESGVDYNLIVGYRVSTRGCDRRIYADAYVLHVLAPFYRVVKNSRDFFLLFSRA